MELTALKEQHKAKYKVTDRVRGEVPGFPAKLMKFVYDRNDSVLFGSNMVKGKVHYNYIDGEYTVDGIPFIVSVGIDYDGKGNADLPADALIMDFKDLPKMFPNNQFS
jgi:hypothetical protein